MYSVNVRSASHAVGAEAQAFDLEASQGMYVEADYIELGALFASEKTITPDVPIDKRPFEMPENLRPLVDWIIAVTEPHLPADREDFPLSRKTIRSASRLGVFPSEKQLALRHGSLRGFYNHFDVNSGYEDMRRNGSYTFEQAVQMAKRIVRQTGRRPRVADFDLMHEKGLCPTGEYISENFGLANLCDVLGYAEVDSWSRDDYIDWAVRVMEVNGNLDLYTINTLAKRQLGPNRRTISNHFRSIERLRMEAEDAIRVRQKERERVSAVCHEAIGVPEGTELPIEIVAHAYLRKALGLAFTTEPGTALADTITSYARREKLERTRAKAHVESQALLLGIQDILDPPNHPITDDQLYVEPEFSDYIGSITILLQDGQEHTRDDIYSALGLTSDEEKRLVWRTLRALVRNSAIGSRETNRRGKTIRLYSAVS